MCRDTCNMARLHDRRSVLYRRELIFNVVNHGICGLTGISQLHGQRKKMLRSPINNISSGIFGYAARILYGKIHKDYCNLKTGLFNLLFMAHLCQSVTNLLFFTY